MTSLAGSASPCGWGPLVKEVSLPASDPLVLRVGGTTLTANRSTGAYIITPGTNGYPAASGWEPVTGWGSRNAQVLIPLLTGFTSRNKT